MLERSTAASTSVSLFLAGDVMTGRGIDQSLPHPGDDRLHEGYLKSARDYVRLAERANGPVKRPVAFDYIWGVALAELERRKPDARIINLETAVTSSASFEPKGINYKMSPANAAVLTAGGIDCCVLANNHVLDWGQPGLIETLSTLDRVGVRRAGAGRSLAEAEVPAILTTQKEARVLVFGFASLCCGVDGHWAATAGGAGVNVVPRLDAEAVSRIGEAILAVRRPHDIAVASIHWGRNWGYDIPKEQIAFARGLIDCGAIDLVHGHSSHHFKAVDVYRGKLILYGCGDFIDDYEGISGYEAFRGDLALMYFPQIDIATGKLESLELVPLQIRNMRLNRVSDADGAWLAGRLDRECAAFGSGVAPGADGALRLHWR